MSLLTWKISWRTQNIQNIRQNDEEQWAARRNICLLDVIFSFYRQIRQGIVIEEGKVWGGTPAWVTGGRYTEPWMIMIPLLTKHGNQGSVWGHGCSGKGYCRVSGGLLRPVYILPFHTGRENEKIMLAETSVSMMCEIKEREPIYIDCVWFQGYAEKSYFLHIPGMKSGKIRKESNSMKLFAFNELFSKEKKSRGQGISRMLWKDQ